MVSLVMKAWRCDGGEIWEHVRYSDKLLASLLRESVKAGVRKAGGPVNRTDTSGRERKRAGSGARLREDLASHVGGTDKRVVVSWRKRRGGLARLSPFLFKAMQADS